MTADVGGPLPRTRPLYVHRAFVSRARLRKLAWYARKAVHQRRHPAQVRRVLLILGSQRSGTTMLSEVLDSDIRTRVFGEFSRLSAHDPDGIRLDPLPVVARELRRGHAHLDVLKPLVESQRARELLDGLPGARAVWLYRDHRDVVSSRSAKFGSDSGRRNLLPIRTGEAANWRADRVDAATRALVEDLYALGMTPEDELALFWCIRNRFYFAQSLEEDDRVVLCRYEDLVRDPVGVLRHLYGWLGLPFQAPPGIAAVSTRSVGKGGSVILSPHVAALCEDVGDQLDAVYRRSALHRAVRG